MELCRNAGGADRSEGRGDDTGGEGHTSRRGKYPDDQPQTDTGYCHEQKHELYEILGKFLLAARLQEGARQAVCETMDAGRPEAFLHLSVSLKKITWYDILPLNGQSAPGSESLMKKVRSVSLKSWFV